MLAGTFKTKTPLDKVMVQVGKLPFEQVIRAIIKNSTKAGALPFRPMHNPAVSKSGFLDATQKLALQERIDFCRNMEKF